MNLEMYLRDSIELYLETHFPALEQLEPGPGFLHIWKYESNFSHSENDYLSNDHITKPPDRVPHLPLDKDVDYWNMLLPEDFPPHTLNR